MGVDPVRDVFLAYHRSGYLHNAIWVKLHSCAES